jgi:P27 family predicted phage terminase small subunit
MKGRIPNPQSLVNLKGDPSNRRGKNCVEPSPPNGEPSCPLTLNKIGKDKWKETFQILKDMNLLSLAETSVLEEFALTYQRFRIADADLKKRGETFTAPSGLIIANPSASTWHKCLEHLMKIQIELGLTPAARSRMRVVLKDKDEKNPWLKVMAS